MPFDLLNRYSKEHICIVRKCLTSYSMSMQQKIVMFYSVKYDTLVTVAMPYCPTVGSQLKSL